MDTPTAGGGGGGGGDCKAFIVVAETPVRDRARVNLDQRLLPRVEKTGSLRVPDTQEGAEQEPKQQPDAEQERAWVPNRPKLGGGISAERGRVPNRPRDCGDTCDGKDGSGPSDLAAPPTLALDGGITESRGASVGVDVAVASCVEALSGSDGGSSSGSVSPDLLCRFPIRATGISEKEKRTLSAAVPGSFAASQGQAGSSDGSDTWPESPDLLGDYACEGEGGLSEVSARKVGAKEVTGELSMLLCRLWTMLEA